MCGEYEGKETFDATTKREAMYYERQGHSVSWESCKICLWEEKLPIVLGSSKINVLN